MANKKHVKMDMFTEEVIDRDDFVCESPLHRAYQKPKPATNHSDKESDCLLESRQDDQAANS